MTNTRESIIDKALNLFSIRGYEAVSMREIAEELGMTKAALYKHFESKRDIFSSIIQRMEREDFCRAQDFDLPVDTVSVDLESYQRTQFSNLVGFTQSQFYYWTEDSFASRFRKMLILEKYNDKGMADLFEQYVCSGPLKYVADLFCQKFGDETVAIYKALEFYAPVFMLYSLYDGAKDKASVVGMLDEHLRRFQQSMEGE